MTSPRFLICWPYTLAQECPFPDDWANPRNYNDTPGDPGGPTKCGIIQTEYNAYRVMNHLPQQPVTLLSKAEGEDIYFNSYWLPHCPTLPVGLDLQFFDECVNTGPTQAVKVLQYSLNISADGIWGPQTMTKVGALLATPEITQTNKSFTARREAVYRLFSGFGEFGKVWEARASSIGATALTMIGG